MRNDNRSLTFWFIVTSFKEHISTQLMCSSDLCSLFSYSRYWLHNPFASCCWNRGLFRCGNRVHCARNTQWGLRNLILLRIIIVEITYRIFPLIRKRWILEHNLPGWSLLFLWCIGEVYWWKTIYFDRIPIYKGSCTEAVHKFISSNK